MELTVESAMAVLQAMFPDALRIYVSEDADYFDGVLTREAFVMVGHNTFRGPDLSECMAQVRAWHKAQELNTVLPQEQKR